MSHVELASTPPYTASVLLKNKKSPVTRIHLLHWSAFGSIWTSSEDRVKLHLYFSNVEGL